MVYQKNFKNNSQKRNYKNTSFFFPFLNVLSVGALTYSVYLAFNFNVELLT